MPYNFVVSVHISFFLNLLQLKNLYCNQTDASLWRVRRNKDILYYYTHSLTHSHSRTHALTHALTHARTHARTHSLTHSLTHSFTHSLIHSFIHSFIILPYIQNLTTQDGNNIRLKKKEKARRPERNHEAYNDSGLLNLR